MAAHEDLNPELKEYLREYYIEKIQDTIEDPESNSVTIAYSDIAEFNEIFAEGFLNQPKEKLEVLQFIINELATSSDTTLTARLSDLPKNTSIGKIKSDHIETLVQIEGTIAGSSSIKTAFESAAHECQRCGEINIISQQTPRIKDEVEKPRDCQACGYEGPYELNVGRSEMVDIQSVVLEQRNMRNDNSKTIKVESEGDLVGSFDIGDDVSAIGIVKLASAPSETTVRDKYLKAVNLSQIQEQEQLTASQQEIQEIVEISNSPTIYEDMVGSIAPTISGHDEEKLAMILQLFSGVRKDLPDGSTVRGDIHILMVGDPGTAKSELLRAAARVAPKAVTVSGTDTTKAGLTSAATPSSGNADPWEIKGGALVKANGGLAVVDNLDGFGKEQFSGLHSTIEDQEVNASKASVTETLPAQTSVLSASNPIYGRFDQYEPIGEQIGMNPRIISQFDLIFVVTDTPDTDEDRKIASDILDKNYAGQLDVRRANLPASEISENERDEAIESIAPVIDPDLLRKYISHAKRSCFPTMTDEAKEIIRDFYIGIREKGADEDAPIPVSARKLEALVRLAEASARVRLGDRVEAEDAERAVSVVRTCLKDIGVDPEAGQFDADVVETGTSKTQRDRIKNIKQLISEIESEFERGAPIDKVLERASKIGMDVSKAEQEIEKLRRKGKVYEPAQGHLRTAE